MTNAAETWGLPDWLAPAAYGDVGKWGEGRWRWEFTRRREDFRADFDAIAEYTEELYRSVYSGPEWADKVDLATLLRRDDPGFSGQTTVQQFAKYGIELLNPRISDQSRLGFQADPTGTGMVEGDGELFAETVTMSLRKGTAGVRIDLDRPIAAQLHGAMDYLTFLQKKRRGRVLQSRRHPRTWLRYLRVLDGRECGATWHSIFEGVLLDKTLNKNPEQEAQRNWKSARHLMFNWPS